MKAFTAAVVLATAGWWACRLWGDIPGRAFDPSDPAAQLTQAVAAAGQWRAGGARAWAGAVIHDPGGKPAQSGLLSLAILAGLRPDGAGYQRFTGFFTIALFALLAFIVGREGGFLAGLLFAGFSLTSNAALGQALYGGHSWLGQFFLWAAAWMWLAQGPPLRARRAFAFGLLLGACALASYHAAPAAAALAAAWLLLWGEGCVRRKGLDILPLAAFAAAPVLCAWSMAGASFRALLLQSQLAGLAARAYPGIYRGGAAYFWDWLRSSESPVFLLALLALAALEAAARLRRLAEEPRAWPWLVAPAGALVFTLLPQAPKLGRVCLPALVALFPLAALGGERLLRRFVANPWRLPGALGLAAVLLLSNAARRAGTWQAFHAGARIDSEMASRGGAGPAIVVGLSLPYAYQPGREIRVNTMAELRQAVSEGHKWILTSEFSSWWWIGFMSKAKFDIPLDKVYASAAPFVAVPGVESSSFQPFSNEAQYALIRAGRIPFPMENRLYRAADFLAAAGR